MTISTWWWRRTNSNCLHQTRSKPQGQRCSRLSAEHSTRISRQLYSPDGNRFVSSRYRHASKGSLIRLDNSMLERLPPTYPLTVCQFGICQTVTVKHIPTWSDGRG